MLKIHSFLKRTKESIRNLFSVKVGRYKKSMIAMAYILVTVLFILSPDTTYHSTTGAVAKAKVVSLINRVEEETENAAIIQTNNIDEIQTKLQELQLLQMQKDVLGRMDNSTDNEKVTEEEAIVAFSRTNVSDVDSTLKEEKEDGLTAQNERELGIELKKESTEQDVAIEDEEKEKESEKSEEGKEVAQAEVKTASSDEGKESKEETPKATEDSKEVTSNYAVKCTSDDIVILQRIVEAEATGEDVKGKILVANVVLNRVKSKKFPNSIEDVVFQKKQFSPIRDGRYNSVSVTSTTKDAVERALQGEDYSEGALYFSARSKASKKNMNWFDKNLNYLFRHGGHEFFK